MIAQLIESTLIGGARLLVGAQARWEGCAPTEEQRIYVANHSSHIDFLLLSSALPATLRRRTRPVAAADYWTKGRLRQYLSEDVFRSILVNRTNTERNPLEGAAAALRAGDSLIYFPEGTRGPGGTLQALKPGIFHLARWFPSIAIIPVWIENSSRVLPKGFHIPVPLLSSLTFGAPVRWTGQQQDEFLTELRTAIEALAPREP